VVIGSGLLYQLMIAASREPSETVVALHISSCVIAFGLAIASLQIPRRPDVFYHGAQVDRAGTVSAFDRLTFRWAAQLMSVATTKGDLDMDDMPALGSQLRSADASARWNAKKHKRGLFIPFLRQFAPALVKQWSLSVLYAIFGYLPWLITLKLLQTIESTKFGESTGSQVWLLLICMGIAKITGAVRSPHHPL
jgi:hypothetical protein